MEKIWIVYVTYFIIAIVFLGTTVLNFTFGNEVEGRITKLNNVYHSDGITYSNWTISFQNYPSQNVIFKCDYYGINSTIMYKADLFSYFEPVVPYPTSDSYVEGC